MCHHYRPSSSAPRFPLPLPLILTLTLSVCLSLSPSTRCRVQKSATAKFRVPCFLIWWSASRPDPLRAVSEARALTADAHRSLPYLEVSPTKTARRGGKRGGDGWRRISSHPENRFAPGCQLNVGNSNTIALLINLSSRHWCKINSTYWILELQW